MIEPGRLSGGNLSEAERLRRIAELLCEAIARTAAREAVAAPVAADSGRHLPPRPGFMTVDNDADAERVIRYLRFVGSAAPAMIRGTLGLSRTGTHRVLIRLARAGKIIVSGKTRNIAYRLKELEPPADRIMLN
jgi:hypothetical protein